MQSSFCPRCLSLFVSWKPMIFAPSGDARFYQFCLSTLTVRQYPLPTFTSFPHLHVPFSLRMDVLFSRSPFPHLWSLPCSAHTFPSWHVPYSCICSSVFLDTLYSLLQYLRLNKWLKILLWSRFSCQLYFQRSTFIWIVLTRELYVILFSLERMSSLSYSSFIVFTNSETRYLSFSVYRYSTS